MVIEYSGIVIRSVLTDKREKYYDGKVREMKPHCRVLFVSLHAVRISAGHIRTSLYSG